MRLIIIIILIIAAAGSILYLTEDYENELEIEKIKTEKAQEEKEKKAYQAFLAQFQKFYDNPNLDTIDLSNMNIDRLPKGFLDSMKNVVYLNLSSNYFSRFPKNCFHHPTLKHLNISNNDFKQLHIPVVYGTILETLDVSFNKIESIHGVRRLKQLRHLNLQANGMRELNWYEIACGNLEYLNLENNLFKILEGIHYIPSLRTLIARNNHILNIPELMDNPKLEYLDLSYNQIKYFEVTSYMVELPLKTVLLNGNEIEILEENIALKNLEHLELKDCNIYTVHNIEKQHPNLKYLDIRANYETLNRSDSLENLTYIDTLLIE